MGLFSTLLAILSITNEGKVYISPMTAFYGFFVFTLFMIVYSFLFANSSVSTASSSSSSVKVDNFIVDIDGVLIHHNDPIAGSIQALEALNRKNKNVILVTNGAALSREEVRTKLNKMGYNNCKYDVITSASATAAYLFTQGEKIKSVFVLGSAGLILEIKEKNPQMQVISIEETVTVDDVMSASVSSRLRLIKKVDAVVVGYTKQSTYTQMFVASAYIQSGATFIATNMDDYDLIQRPACLGGGEENHPLMALPGNGSIVKAIEASLPTDLKYVKINIGKPSKRVLSSVIKTLDASKTVVIGDRIDTDMELAVEMDCRGFLVETGVTLKSEAKEFGFESFPNLKSAVETILLAEQE